MTPTLSEPVRNTVKVIVRHHKICKDIGRGSDWEKCNCKKSLLIYDALKKKNYMKSAQTRVWAKAEKTAQTLRDSWDPTLRELHRLKAEKERLQVRIEEAVALYIADMITRLGDNGTVRMARSLFGHIDPETKVVTKSGNLFDWLSTIPESDRPIFISELTAPQITAWRNSWDFGSDLTAAQRWSMVKGFFQFCEAQTWIADNPCRKLKPLKATKGNRTAIFTDDQYTKILDAVHGSAPENVPVETNKSWEQRLTTFIELMRWSGMDLVDAVQYRPELVDSEGVLRYHRQKTKVLATGVLPSHLVALLRSVPLERDSVGQEQPFRSKNSKLPSDVRCWEHRLAAIFVLAGIKEVRNDVNRLRAPHAKMFRDTCAVSALRHGASLFTVSKMLGHANPTITAKAYLPWVKELETAQIADARKAMELAIPKTASGKKVVNIGARA